MQGAGKIYLPAAEERIKELRSIIEHKGLGDSRKEYGELDALTKFQAKMEHISGSNPDDWFSFIDNSGTLILKPLAAAPYAHRLLSKGQFKIFMSPTILNFDAFCGSLGLERSKFAELRLPCAFPVKNRPIIFDPVGSMGSRHENETIHRMAKRIKEILKRYREFRGIMHTHSYDRARAQVPC